jgi:hypothetical protein
MSLQAASLLPSSTNQMLLSITIKACMSCAMLRRCVPMCFFPRCKRGYRLCLKSFPS